MSEIKTILVVDDEEDIRKLLQDFLESRNYHVLTAADGSQALELAKKHVPDLIVTDMLLPKVHGVELAQLIKDNFFIPVVGISGVYKKEEINQKIDSEIRELKQNIELRNDGYCPECLAEMVHQDGCVSCHMCGFSECE